MNEGPILVVEDNSDDAELICRELEKRCNIQEVILAMDGEKALDYLYGGSKIPAGERSETPSIVILDLNLGAMKGEQILKRIRSENNTFFIPVIVFSGTDQKSRVETVYRDGANSFVSKPGRYGDFRKAVREIADYWLGINRAAERPGEDRRQN